MRNPLRRKTKWKLPSRRELSMALSLFSKRERTLFFVLLGILLVSTVLILNNINKSFTKNIPIHGGAIREGILGTPRFANPVLASSEPDRDIVSLVYNGLLRKNPDGTLVPDLAESITPSEDGLSYTFVLKQNLFFHDGTPLTANDIVFTINAIKDPIIKSPRRGNWDGVTVEEINDRTVKFTLREPYATFLENTTLGIMPASLWSDTPIELNEANTNPIGSGPYKIAKVSKQSSGVIDGYELESFKNFSLGEPYIQKINLKFYPNEEILVSALLDKEIDQASSISPEHAAVIEEKGVKLSSPTLPRIFGLFFNQNQNQLFTDKSVREGIDAAIDKDRIVRQILKGYGVAIDSPIPKSFSYQDSIHQEIRETREERLERARSVLEKGGWKIGESNFLEKTKTENGKQATSILEFVISTGNAPELAKAAALIQEDLAEIGMRVEVRTFETGNLNQAVIRPRKYDALLFGEIVQTEGDLFAFWHSSQRKDPGLNVAMYTNAKVDKLLEDAFVTNDIEARQKKYQDFEKEIDLDMPAVFLYSPKLVYALGKNLKNEELQRISTPAERFSNVHLWYIKTDRIWKIFSKD